MPTSLSACGSSVRLTAAALHGNRNEPIARQVAKKTVMKPLELHDQRHLEAAQGWFELGNSIEATKELEQITPELRGHPSVLEVRYEIYAAAKKWEYAAEIARAISEMVPDSPFGFIHHAYSLHELRRTQEAWNVLLPVVDRSEERRVGKECRS